MPSDTERVLRALIDQPVSESHLSTRLDIPPRRVQRVVAMLERAGYVRVQQVGRVQWVVPTRLAYQQISHWRDEPSQPLPARRRPALLRWVGLGLLIAAALVAWWWPDLFPAAAKPQLVEPTPLSHTTPVVAATPLASPADTAAPLPSAVPTEQIQAETAPPAPPPTETPTPLPLPTAIPIETPDPAAVIPTPVPLIELSSAEAINILLMGSDTSAGSWRTDTLIIVSVDPALPSVSLLSIPRDLYVYIPGWGMNRINTADAHGERAGYPGGGAGLVKTTIEYNLGVRVHYYARVNFDGFVDLLETLGGVDVVVDCELHDTFPDPDAPGGATDIDLLPGVHHLEAKQALWYSRSRWNTSDFDRGRRQQRVLRAAFQKIKQLELLPRLPELWDELTATVQTDLSLERALWLAQIAARLDTDVALKSRFIDYTVLQPWMTPQGAAVQLPVYERVGPLIQEALAPPDAARAQQATVRVEVLNGTPWTDWGVLAADRLLWEGFEVVRIAPADHNEYLQTTLVDLSGVAKGSPTERLAQILSVRSDNVSSEPVTEGSEVDFRVIVGRDYSPCYQTYWRKVHGAPAEDGN